VGQVEQVDGGSGAYRGDREESDSTRLCEKDREGEKDLEDVKRSAGHGTHVSTIHHQTQDGEIFLLSWPPCSAASCIRLIHSNVVV
jgi:hypothetical protein